MSVPQSKPWDEAGLVLSLEETRQSFVMEDVTTRPRSLQWAFDLVVQGYLPLSSQVLDPEKIRQAVCDDEYHRHGIARTLVLTGLHPESGEREPLGTMRVTVGASRARELGLYPLETMGLMAPRNGWKAFVFEGFDVDRVAEGGRMAVSPTCRIGKSREVNLAAVVFRALVEGTFRFAQQHYSKTQLWGVLPYYVRDRLEALGIRVIPAPDMLYRSEENAEIFEKYDRYWQQSRPQFCKVILPSALTE